MLYWLKRIADSTAFGVLMFSLTLGVAFAIILVAWDAGERANLEQDRSTVETKLDRIERKVDTMLIEEYHYRIEKGYEAPTPTPDRDSR